MLSFWKINQALALHPAVNGYVDDLFDSETDSFHLSSAQETSTFTFSALFFIQHDPAALVSCPTSLDTLCKLWLLLFPPPPSCSTNASSR